METRNNYFIHNAFVVNEAEVFCADVLVQDGKIARVLKERAAVPDLQFAAKKTKKKRHSPLFCIQ